MMIKYVALIADNRDVIVYDISANTIITSKSLSSLGYSGSAVQWVSMSQSGNYVVIAGSTASASYDRNLNKIATLLPNHLPHGDLGYDSSGNDVYVHVCPMKMVRLSSGQITSLFSTECGHVSTRNVKRPGWAYVNFGAGRPQDVLAVKLDSSKTVERFTHHRSSQAQYIKQTHSAASPDGTKVMFASDWNGTAEVNSYVVQMPQSDSGPPLPVPSPPPPPPPPPGDTTLPTVSIVAPVNGSTVSGSAVTVSANASDNVGVASVDFKVDGTTLFSDTTSPYATIWNTTTGTNAPHTITALARDAAGNVKTSTGVSVTVNNVSPPPSSSSTHHQQVRNRRQGASNCEHKCSRSSRRHTSLHSTDGCTWYRYRRFHPNTKWSHLVADRLR